VLYHWLFHAFSTSTYQSPGQKVPFPGRILGRPNAFWGADASSPDTYASLVPALQRDWSWKKPAQSSGFSEGPDGVEATLW